MEIFPVSKFCSYTSIQLCSKCFGTMVSGPGERPSRPIAIALGKAFALLSRDPLELCNKERHTMAYKERSI